MFVCLFLFSQGAWPIQERCNEVMERPGVGDLIFNFCPIAQTHTTHTDPPAYKYIYKKCRIPHADYITSCFDILYWYFYTLFKLYFVLFVFYTVYTINCIDTHSAVYIISNIHHGHIYYNVKLNNKLCARMFQWKNRLIRNILLWFRLQWCHAEIPFLEHTSAHHLFKEKKNNIDRLCRDGNKMWAFSSKGPDGYGYSQ